jgi:hypothetical protein
VKRYHTFLERAESSPERHTSSRDQQRRAMSARWDLVVVTITITPNDVTVLLQLHICSQSLPQLRIASESSASSGEELHTCFSQMTCSGCRPSSSSSEAWSAEQRNPRTYLQMDSSSYCKLASMEVAVSMEWPQGEMCSMSGPQTWQAYGALGKTQVRTSNIMACGMSRTP